MSSVGALHDVSVSASTSDGTTNVPGELGAASYTFALPTPGSPDGNRDVSVSVRATEFVDSTVNRHVDFHRYQNPLNNSCFGTKLGETNLAPETEVAVPRVGPAATETVRDAFVVDQIPPDVTVTAAWPLIANLGEQVSISSWFRGGTAGTSYVLTDSIGTQSTTSPSAQFSSVLGEFRTLGVQFACDAPTGLHRPQSVASALTNACGEPVPNRSGEALLPVSVEAGFPRMFVGTSVLGVMPTGAFNLQSCVDSSLKSQSKVTNDPGSSHVLSVIRVPSPRSGSACFDGTTRVTGGIITVKLPAGWAYFDNGNRPQVQIFLGLGTIDFANPTANSYANITALSSQSVDSNGLWDTITPSLGKNSTLVGDTLVVMSHVQYVGPWVPSNVRYTFQTAASIDVLNVSFGGVATLTGSSWDFNQITQNPNYACQYGNRQQ